jgi:hypothetical protein
MEGPVPRFFEAENKLLAHLEWEAIRYICFDGKHIDMSDAYPKYEQRQFYWIDPFNEKATDEQRQIRQRLMKRDITGLDEFYALLKPLLTPRARGKALKDKKTRTAQAAFQRNQLGDAFIENESLITAARKCAFGLSEAKASAEDIAAKADELVVEHAESEPLSDEQRQTLIQFIQRQMDRHLKPDTVEAKIIDADDKSLYFMWGKIKRCCPKGDTFAWPTAKAASEAHCSKAAVGPIMKKLASMGAVSLIQSGKAGRNSGRAAIYRREV